MVFNSISAHNVRYFTKLYNIHKYNHIVMVYEYALLIHSIFT
jgi:hypothetical protein